MAAAAQAQPEVLPDSLAEQWLRLDALPCVLTVEIPLADFTVADLVQLTPGRILTSRWTVAQDVPLRIYDQLIAWSEFEVVQDHLAVRLTELA